MSEDDTRSPYAKAHDAIIAATVKYNDALAEARQHAIVEPVIMYTAHPNGYVRLARLRARE